MSQRWGCDAVGTAAATRSGTPQKLGPLRLVALRFQISKRVHVASTGVGDGAENQNLTLDRKCIAPMVWRSPISLCVFLSVSISPHLKHVTTIAIEVYVENTFRQFLLVLAQT